jgi:tetratricopeptide (TPR) repeat protein
MQDTSIAAATVVDRENSCPIPDIDACRILGVYSMGKQSRTGQGTTTRAYDQKTYWFVRRSQDGEYYIQALNANSIPSGPVSLVSKGEFLANYQPESGYYEKRCLPFLESLKKKIAQADQHLAEGDLDGAEREFLKALLLDEKHPKANIALGEISLQKRDGKKLAAALRRIFNIDVLFTQQERHLFNEFAISLRKEKKFPEAVAFYDKALERNADDENLHFNLARALAEAGDTAGASGHLKQALALRPDFEQAKRFLAHLQSGPSADAAADAPLPDITAPGDIPS